MPTTIIGHETQPQTPCDDKCDISVLVIAHRESLLVHRTLRSVRESAEFARSQGITVEVIVVLDRGDHLTRRCIQEFPTESFRVIEVNVGDLALARESGRKEAAGEYIALIDGDDLYGQEWLAKAYTFAKERDNPKDILHAEYQVFFEADNFHVQYFSSEGPRSREFRDLCLAATNHWTSILFFNRRAFHNRPFLYISRDRANPVNFGFGFEDWHWISEQLSQGSTMQVVPDTCNFVRRKRSNSMLTAYSVSRALLPPSRLLCPVRIGVSLNQRINEPSKNAVAELPLVAERAGKKNHVFRRFGKFIKNRFPGTRNSFRKFKAKLRRKYAEKNWLPTELRQRHEFLTSACRKIHLIEPKIFPSLELLQKQYSAGKESTYLSYKYQYLCQGVVGKPTHVFLVPWLKRGGSDLETLNYIKALHVPEDGSSVLVVSTVDSDSPWKDRLPEGVPFLNFGHIFNDVAYEDQKRMLGTFLVQLGPSVIHNVNSPIGYHLFREYGDALVNQSKLFASVFCEDITSEGRIAGYVVDDVVDVADRLTAIFADNQRILNKLSFDFGICKEKLHLHYQPIEYARQAIPINAAKGGDVLRVLWAGRMDRQKRVDVLFEIAKKLEGAPVHFSIYGDSVLQDSDNRYCWKKLTNVTCHGAYDGFHSLPHHNFDLLLHTAQWEGLPNVLLESLSVGLPVVASSVGGVPELILDKVTGRAIEPFDDVQQYCDALMELHNNRKLLLDYARRGAELVKQRHTWENFNRELGTVQGYKHFRRLEEVA